eukprot:110245-Rhodomonas_salina.1
MEAMLPLTEPVQTTIEGSCCPLRTQDALFFPRFFFLWSRGASIADVEGACVTRPLAAATAAAATAAAAAAAAAVPDASAKAAGEEGEGEEEEEEEKAAKEAEEEAEKRGEEQEVWPMLLRARCAVSRTEIAYGMPCARMLLRARYADCGTERAYAATRSTAQRSTARSAALSAYALATRCPVVTRVLPALEKQVSYALSAYAPARRGAVLTSRMLLRSCCARCGTELAYAATLLLRGV